MHGGKGRGGGERLKEEEKTNKVKVEERKTRHVKKMEEQHVQGVGWGGGSEFKALFSKTTIWHNFYSLSD